MKNKAALLTVFMLAAVLALTACNYPAPKLTGVQKQDYVITSNGGSMVQYGNYVYFINGYTTVDDPYSDNGWDNDVSPYGYKGAIYRAELHGGRVDYLPDYTNVPESGVFDYKISVDSATGTAFVTEKAYDSDDNEINVISVQCVVPKIISMGGYAKGGITIIDNWIYYATANNKKDTSGAVQTNKTDFMRTKLDGSGTQVIATSSTAEVSAYAFYKHGSEVFLNFYESQTIYAVRMTGSSVKEKARIDEEGKITSVIFPNRNVYYKGIDVNNVSGYIYYTKAGSGNPYQSGNVIYMSRPNGSQIRDIAHSQTDMTLEAVSGNKLFYRVTEVMFTVLKANDLRAEIAWENNLSNKNTAKTSVTDVIGDVSLYTQLYPYHARPDIDTVVVWATDSSGLYRIENNLAREEILSEGVTIQAMYDNILYVTLSSDSAEDKILYAVDGTVIGGSKVKITQKAYKASGYLALDVAAGHLAYISSYIDDYASYYMKVTPYGLGFDHEELFIGKVREQETEDYEEE